MAKVKLSAPYENFLGRDSPRFTPNGNVVFQRHQIPLTRSFTRPDQPNNAAQYSSRYIFSLANIGWNALDESDRDAWAALGLTITRTNSAGFDYHPSGKSLYTESFIISVRNGETPIGTPPSTVSFPPMLPATDVQTGGESTATIVYFPSLAFDTTLLVYFTRPLSTAVRSLKGRNWLNPTLQPFDPDWVQGSLFNAGIGDDNVQFSAGSLAYILAEDKPVGVRITVLDAAAIVAGPTYDVILTPHGP